MRCSLIIPAYNSEKSLASCLESALHQSLPREDYEIILVDDGSSDDTRKIANSYPIKYCYQENRGPASARNGGAREAAGEILIFTDSDCMLDFDFLKNIIAPIEQNPEVVGVQGSYRTRQKEFMAHFVQVEIETRYQKMSRYRYSDFIGTYAAAYKTDIFRKYGGFDESFTVASGEDIEFSYKLYQHGHKMVFAPEAFVYHQHPTKLSQYIRSKFYRGFWKLRAYRMHPKKVIHDSYTPQSLKFQVLSSPFLVIFGILSGFNKSWLIPLLLMFIYYWWYSLSFRKLFKEKKYPKAVLIPFVLYLRAVSLMLGMVFGAFNEIKSQPAPGL